MRSGEENQAFAKIILELGFCTPAQIERCLRIQTDTTEGLSLGQSLLREGHISDAQYSEVLQKMRPGARKTAAPPAKRKSLSAQEQEDDLLGKLALREGWISAEELSRCRREEAPGAVARTLGEILISRGALLPAQVKELLGRLTRRAMSCRACKASYSILSIAESKFVACPRCGKPLAEGQLASSTSAPDPFATGIFSATIKGALQPPRNSRFGRRPRR